MIMMRPVLLVPSFANLRMMHLRVLPRTATMIVETAPTLPWSKPDVELIVRLTLVKTISSLSV